MRILHVLNELAGGGNGIENVMIDLAAAQVKAGHTVAAASAGGEQEDLIEKLGVQHLPVTYVRGPLSGLHALFELRTQIRSFRPDVVHAHVLTGVLLSKLWSGMLGFPLVAHLHNVHQRKSRWMGVADRVIAVSASVGRTMVREGIAEQKIRVVLNRPLGSPRLLDQKNRENIALPRPSVVTVAGMYQRKGISDLIEAFARVQRDGPEAHLYLVGDGPDLGRFRKQAAGTACAERIHFAGFISQPLTYMKQADVFVLAARRESLGLVLIEARVAGCAIVASDADGIPEALDGGAAGLLYPAGDVASLADALRRLLSDDAERKLWQVRAGRGLEAWEYTRMADAVEAVYRELVPGAA